MRRNIKERNDTISDYAGRELDDMATAMPRLESEDAVAVQLRPSGPLQLEVCRYMIWDTIIIPVTSDKMSLEACQRALS